MGPGRANATQTVVLGMADTFKFAVRGKTVTFDDTRWNAAIDFHALAEAIPHLVFVTDADGENLYTNVRYQTYTGLNANRLLGVDWVNTLHPDDQARAKLQWAKNLATAEAYEAEYRFRSHDGEYRWYLCRASPVVEHEQIVRWIGACRDIDDQRRRSDCELQEAQSSAYRGQTTDTAVDRLRESEARFRSIYENAFTGIAISDFDGWFTQCNPAFANIIGYDEAELAGTLFTDLIHPDDHQANMAQVTALRTRTIGSFETFNRYLRKSGEPVWVHKYVLLMFDAANKPNGVLALVTDMTEIKQHELALAESDQRFRGLAATLPALIFVADPDGANIYSNPQFAAYSGLSEAELMGDGWLKVIHPDDRERAASTWERSWKDQEGYEAEYRFRAADGNFRSFLVRGNPVRDPLGTVVQWVGTCTDISDAVALREALATSRIQLESANADLETQVAARTRELQRTNKSLQVEIKRREVTQTALAQAQKLEALGQLTSGIAHDFNNILAAIAGGLTLIESRVDDEFVKDIARQSKDAAFRGAKLIKQMLGFARQEVLAPVSVDLVLLANDLEPLINQAVPGNVVAFDFQPDLPKVTVDPVLLETALLNLAVNARDAMPGGGTLLISARRSLAGERGRPVELAEGEAVAISVRDNGTGMPPGVLQRVTEPFYTTKAPGKGTGLGLAMVHGFTAQSGGAMRIESRPDKGTVITLYLPVTSDRADLPMADATGIESVVTGTGAVLLVDDDSSVRAVTAAQLRDFGYAVTEADGYDAALAELDSCVKFDCVVSDVVMPDGDGITLAGAIRTRHRDLPIMFITGRADSDRVAGEIVLQKPFTAADLAQFVARNLERAVSERETLSKIGARARSQGLKDMLGHWVNARTVAKTPLFASFDPELCTEPRNLVVMKADPAHLPMRLEFLSAGEELETLLGRQLRGTEMDVRGSDALGSIEESYRRSMKTGLPVYDYTRTNLGDGQIELFERLILPHSSDGRITDRLVAIIILNKISAT
jgi:PAS domain S-box-containing protein